MSEILKISNINNKSIDVTLDRPISRETEFYLKSDDDSNYLTPVEMKIVTENSYSGSDEYTKTIVFENGKELKTNTNYTLQLTVLNETLTDEMSFVCREFPRMNNFKVDVVGDRILKVSFEYPVRNLDATILSGSKYSLANFYAVFFDLDSSITTSQSDPQHFPGTFHYGEGNVGRVSEDFRSIEIQSLDAFPNTREGDYHRLFINFNKDYNPALALRDFSDVEAGGRKLPTLDKPFVIQTLQEKAKVVELIPLSRTEILARFDKDVILDEAGYFNNDVISIKGANGQENILALNGKIATVYINTGINPPESEVQAGRYSSSAQVAGNPPTEYHEVILTNNSPLDIKNLQYARSIERNGLKFNELIFHLRPDIQNALPIGVSTITIRNIRDAYGSIIDEKTQSINPPIIKPRLLDVDEEYEADESYNKFKFTFSIAMDVSKVAIKENYKIFNDKNIEQNISSITVDPNLNTEEYRISIRPQLAAGKYRLIVKNITDTLETVMEDFDGEITVTDTTVPVVEDILVIKYDSNSVPEKITENNNVLIVVFNEPMKMSGANSVLDPSNYKYQVIDNVTQAPAVGYNEVKIFDKNVKITAIDDRRVRITLPTSGDLSFANNLAFAEGAIIYNTPISLDYEVKLYIGHCTPKIVKYVTNAVDNILPICDVHHATKVVEPIDLENETLALKSENQLEWYLPSSDLNEFNVVDKSNFQFASAATGGTIYSIANIAKSSDNKKIIITFDGTPFSSFTTDIFVEIRPDQGRTTDLFNKPLQAMNGGAVGTKALIQLVNEIPTRLMGASIINTQGTLDIAMKFSQEIISTTKEDFLVSDKLSTKVLLDSTDFPVNRTEHDTILLKCRPLVDGTDFKVSVGREIEHLLTIDKNFQTIEGFNNEEVLNYSAKAMTWTTDSTAVSTNMKMAGSEFIVDFDVDIIAPMGPILPAGAFKIDSYTSSSATANASITINKLGTIEFIGGDITFGSTSAPSQVIVELDKEKNNRLKITFGSDCEAMTYTKLAGLAIFKPTICGILDKTQSYFINSKDSVKAQRGTR